MRKLILYSDQMIEANKKIDIELLRVIGKEKPRIGYIPAASDINRKYYRQKAEYYQELGVAPLFYFDLDQEYDETKLDQLLSCDAIHLSGGNTYYFLYLLKKRRFIPVLRDYVSSGKVLIGVSAGSILMSGTIEIARFGDENLSDLQDLRALDLVDFEFMPHWNKDDTFLDEVKLYSKMRSKTIYACNDGDGIIIENDQMRFFGDMIKIANGIEMKIPGVV